MENVTLNELRKIEFHDGIPLEFEINLEKNIFKFAFRKESESPIIELVFINVSIINIENLFFSKYIDINTVDFDENNSIIEVRMIFNIDLGQPTSNIYFKCERVELNRMMSS